MVIHMDLGETLDKSLDKRLDIDGTLDRDRMLYRDTQ